jgi:branched-subunit amino acid transport protein AzlD
MPNLRFEIKALTIFQYMRWDTIFAVVPLCISSAGILLTIVTFAIFFKNRDTPLVRASGRELSYVILSGLLVCYLNTYILLAKPGRVVCLLQR